jgi:hypothetical protein
VIAVDHRLARVFEPAILDDRDFEGGPAHVGRDDVAVAEHVSQMLRADDTSGRSALEHADGTSGGFINGNETAVALHDQHGPGIAGTGEKLGELRQIRLGDATDVSINHGAGCPFILARHRRDIR